MSAIDIDLFHEISNPDKINITKLKDILSNNNFISSDIITFAIHTLWKLSCEKRIMLDPSEIVSLVFTNVTLWPIFYKMDFSNSCLNPQAKNYLEIIKNFNDN